MIVSDRPLNQTKFKHISKLNKFKVYYSISNLLSIVIFALFVKTLSNTDNILNKSEINTIIIITSSLNLIASFSLITILTSNESKNFQCKLIEYCKNVPLTFIAYFYLTRIYYIKLNNYYFFILLLATLYFSIQSILNLILIEAKNSKLVNQIFKFLFRYFFFVSKSMSLVLYLSTFNDDIASSKSSFKVFFSFVTFILVTFILSSTWFYFKSKLNFFQILFESFIFLIDYNDKFFKYVLSKSVKKANLDIKLSKIQTVIYFIVNFIFILTSSYFWFFNSIEIYQQNQQKTTLLSLLIEEKNRLIILNLIDLEEKIRLRQFELVVVFGSFIIAILAFYIHYSFYENEQGVEKYPHFLNRQSLMEQARKSLGNCPEAIPSVVDSFNECSSLSSLTDTSLSQKFDYYVDSRNNFTNLNKQKSFSLHFSSIPYEDKIIYGYDTSSGVISSTTSISSIYKEFSNFYRFSEPFSLWQSEKTFDKSSMTINNLSLHNRKLEQSAIVNTNSKVLTWIEKSGSQENDLTKLSPKFHSTNLDFLF